MNGICKQDATHPYSLAYYNCWHGLGHGLTIRFTQDIFRALRFCNCDHARAGSASRATAACSCRTSSPTAAACTSAVDLKPSDPIYPCDAVTKQQKPSCYLMQTSYVLQVKNWNLPVAFRICDRVEAGYVGTCYRSMGRDISGAALLDPGQGRRAVRAGRAAHRAECIAGAAANAVYDRHARADGRRALPARPPGRPRGLPRPRTRPSRRCSARLDRFAPNGTSVRCMRCMLAIAMLAAVAALTFGGLATRATPGQASLVGGRGPTAAASRERSPTAHASCTPGPATARALQTAFARAHGSPRGPPPRRVLEATHRGVLWALATFALADGTVVSERFSRRGGAGLARSRADARALPGSCRREVRRAWRLTACQTS